MDKLDKYEQNISRYLTALERLVDSYEVACSDEDKEFYLDQILAVERIVKGLRNKLEGMNYNNQYNKDVMEAARRQWLHHISNSIEIKN